MRRNKHLFIFVGLLTLLTASYFFVFVKFFPILIHHTFYYCRGMAKVISLNLPGNLETIVVGVLGLSILYTIFRFLMTSVHIYRFRRLLSGSVVSNHKWSLVFKSVKLHDKVVVLNEGKPFAYCFGIRKPKIYITSGLLSMVDERELKVILQHEKYHLEHRDNLTLLLATFIESLFPFFPVLHDFTRIYKTERELLADQAAIENETDKQSLSSTLKKLLQYEPFDLPTVAPAIADSDTLETRIKSLLSMKTNHHRLEKRNVFFSLISVFILVGLMATPVNAVELHKDGVDVIVVCNQNVSCESTCRDKSFRTIQSIQSPYTSRNSSTNY